MAADRDYVLGTEEHEIERLGVQHRVWRHVVFDAWARARVGPGSRVLDVGAGPGHATLDLAELVGARGRVLAVERSARFASFVREQAKASGVQHIAVAEMDLMEDAIEEAGFDAAWCRWVACFVSSPAVLVRRIHDALRPRGIAVFHEYVDYASWRFMPGRPAIDRFVAEVIASWRATGGEPDVSRTLPALLEGAGFTVISARPFVFALRPTDDMWRWPAGFIRTGAPRLLDLGRVDRGWVDRVIADLEEAERHPGSWMLTPMVFEILAERTA